MVTYCCRYRCSGVFIRPSDSHDKYYIQTMVYGFSFIDNYTPVGTHKPVAFDMLYTHKNFYITY